MRRQTNVICNDGFYVIHKGKTQTTYLAGSYRRLLRRIGPLAYPCSAAARVGRSGERRADQLLRKPMRAARECDTMKEIRWASVLCFDQLLLAQAQRSC
jgi:hypothetical protein